MTRVIISHAMLTQRLSGGLSERSLASVHCLGYTNHPRALYKSGSTKAFCDFGEVSSGE